MTKYVSKREQKYTGIGVVKSARYCKFVYTYVFYFNRFYYLFTYIDVHCKKIFTHLIVILANFTNQMRVNFTLKYAYPENACELVKLTRIWLVRFARITRNV